MIGATAQGVRLSQSKLRYYTQDFSYSLFSFVRGREVWRFTGAQILASREQCGIADVENKKLYVRILSLLKRLLPGEEKNERLFEVIEKFYHYLLISALEKEKRELVEYLTVLRILNLLGYIYNKDSFQNILANSTLDEETLGEVGILKESILKEINNGLKESQL